MSRLVFLALIALNILAMTADLGSINARQAQEEEPKKYSEMDVLEKMYKRRHTNPKLD